MIQSDIELIWKLQFLVSEIEKHKEFFIYLYIYVKNYNNTVRYGILHHIKIEYLMNLISLALEGVDGHNASILEKIGLYSGFCSSTMSGMLLVSTLIGLFS